MRTHTQQYEDTHTQQHEDARYTAVRGPSCHAGALSMAAALAPTLTPAPAATFLSRLTPPKKKETLYEPLTPHTAP